MTQKKSKSKGKGGRPRLITWSVNYKACRSCKTQSRNGTDRHHARGYCFRCYHRLQAARIANPETTATA